MMTFLKAVRLVYVGLAVVVMMTGMESVETGS
jgi:hypothetical protein